MKYPYFRGLEADRYSFYRVPKALIKVDLFEKMSGDAKLLYAVLLDRMNLSLKNGWQDENGNAYIICTIDEIMDSIRCARQKAVKLLDELEHEYQLIERRRQGLGKPNLLYVKDLYAGLSESNYWKYENQTSGGLKSELPGVWKSNGSKTDINNTDSSETDLIYSAQSGENISGEMREDERYRFYFQDKLEIPILEKNFPHDREILMEILELLVETVTSRKKFLRICGEEKPKEVVKSRLMKLDSMHIQYVMECLKSNTTQVRNIKQYLLATLYNAPPRLTAITLHRSDMISDGAAEAIKEDDAMSVFFMDFDMAPSVIWARDLYDQMQIRSDFRKWFPRMCQYGFVEGRDYEFVPRVRPQDEGGRTVQRYVKDYRITLEMAKQLYKLHHFHKNDCFRSCEGQHCMGTDHWMQAVIELLHQHKCKSHAPPKRFYESQPPDSLVTTTQIAKEYGCGAKVFNRLLHLHGIQYRANNQWVLYAKHQDKGYTANLVFRLHRSDGSAVEKLHTAWTHKGRKFLYHELKRHGILPMAEQED